MAFLPKKRPRKPPEEKLKVRVVYRPPKVPAEFPPRKKAQPPTETSPRVPAEAVKKAPAKAPEVVGETIRKFPIKIIAPIIIVTIIVSTIVFVIYPNFLAKIQEEQVTASVEIENATFIQTGTEYSSFSQELVYWGFIEVSGTATLPMSTVEGGGWIPLEFMVLDPDHDVIAATIQSCPWAFAGDRKYACHRISGQPATGKWRVTYGLYDGESTLFATRSRYKIYKIMATVWYEGKAIAEDEAVVTIP